MATTVGDASSNSLDEACYNLSRSCQGLFESYLATPVTGRRAYAEEQQARFNIWAANIGVFAEARASLDFRLQEDTEVRAMVTQLLDLIHRNLRRAIEIKNSSDTKELGKAAGTRPRTKARFLMPSLKSRRTPPPPPEPTQDEVIEQVLLVVKETIDRLQRLSSVIRQSSTQNRYLKAATFISRDEDGGDISTGFREYAIWMVKRDYKSASNDLCEKLGTSIFVRRNAFLYAKRHQRKLARDRAKDSTPLVQTRATVNEEVSSHSQVEVGSIKSKLFSSALKGKAKSTRSAALSGTTVPVLPKGGLNPNILQRLNSPPQPSVAGSASSVSVQDIALSYPRSPVIKPGLDECLCPYCFDSLQKDVTLNKRRWRQHVDRDLEPYVCVFPECQGSLEYFRKFEEWVAHTQTFHSFEWYCDAAAHAPEVFNNKQAFQSHMRTSHAGTFTESQLPVITKLSARKSPRPFQICPLCDCLPEDIEVLQKKIGNNALDRLPQHIAGHLKSLAFISLPWREDIEDGEDEHGSKRAATFSHIASMGNEGKVEGDMNTMADPDVGQISLSFDDPPGSEADVTALARDYDDEILDILDTIDPEIANLSTLTNVQNSLFVPNLSRYLDRRPTYDLSLTEMHDYKRGTKLEWKFIREYFYDDMTKSFLKKSPYSLMDDAKLRIYFPKAFQPITETYGDQQELLNWLSTVAYSNNYDAARQRHEPETGNWLIQDHEGFRRWQNNPNSFLWLSGKVGSGKTILSSSVINYLSNLYHSDPHTAVGYFYFSFSNQHLGTSEMLSSLIRQLYYQQPDRPEISKVLRHNFEQRQFPEIPTLEATLLSLIAGFSKVYLILDALDECPSNDGEGKHLISVLNKLHGAGYGGLHLFCTNRQEFDIELIIDKPPLSSPVISIDLSDYPDSINQDICLYVEKALLSPHFDYLPLGLMAELKGTIPKQADGMFLYADLQLHHVQSAYSMDSARQAALYESPPVLDEVYDHMLSRVDPQVKERALTLLTWLSLSFRPLLLLELAEILVLDLKKPHQFDDPWRLGRAQDVLKYLPGGITVLKVNNVHDAREVQLAHWSIREYLLSNRIANGLAGDFAINRSDSHLHLSEFCLDYHMHFSDTEPQASQETTMDISLEDYSAHYWIHHLERVPREKWSSSIISKAQLALTPGSKSLFNMMQVNDHNQKSLLDWIMSTNDFTPLCATAFFGAVQLTEFLLDHGADINKALPGPFCSALQVAACYGNEDVVRLLLSRGADANAQGGKHGDALQAAALCGNERIVQHLLENGADINAQRGFYGTALGGAVYSGKEKVTQLLLDKGANVNAQVEGFMTPLQAAIAADHLDTARILLLRGAKLDLPLEKGADAKLVGHERLRVLRFLKNPTEYLEPRSNEPLTERFQF